MALGPAVLVLIALLLGSASLNVYLVLKPPGCRPEANTARLDQNMQSAYSKFVNVHAQWTATLAALQDCQSQVERHRDELQKHHDLVSASRDECTALLAQKDREFAEFKSQIYLYQ